MSGAASSMGAASAGSSANMAAGTSAVIPQVSVENGHGLPYMTAVEEETLQALLRRAKHTGQLSAQLMQARVSGLVITEEQKAMVEEGKIMTFPDQQFPWVPKVRAKAKAKMAPAVPAMKYVGEDHGGAMTDASKRRFTDDLVDEDESFAEFEVVQAIKEFNGEFSTAASPLVWLWDVELDHMGVDLLCLDQAMQDWALLPLVKRMVCRWFRPQHRWQLERWRQPRVQLWLWQCPLHRLQQWQVFPANAPLAQTTKYAVQGLRTDPPSENTPWYPEINEEEQTGLVSLPPNITSAKEWGRTLVTMAKYKERRWTYESMLRMSLGGHGEVAQYLDFILSKYADTFKRFGGRTQAADFAGYLLRYNVRILKVPGSGFNRELAWWGGPELLWWWDGYDKLWMSSEDFREVHGFGWLVLYGSWKDEWCRCMVSWCRLDTCRFGFLHGRKLPWVSDRCGCVGWLCTMFWHLGWPDWQQKGVWKYVTWMLPIWSAKYGFCMVWYCFWAGTTMYLWLCLCGALIWINDIWIWCVFALFQQFGWHSDDNRCKLIVFRWSTCELDGTNRVFGCFCSLEFILS